ncbi:hypothetical protein ACK3YJ_01600, partial [Aeromonas caviae]
MQLPFAGCGAHLGRCATPVGGGHGRSRPDALGGLAIDRPGPNTGCGALGQSGHSTDALGGLAIDRPGPNTGCGALGQSGH